MYLANAMSCASLSALGSAMVIDFTSFCKTDSQGLNSDLMNFRLVFVTGATIDADADEDIFLQLFLFDEMRGCSEK